MPYRTANAQTALNRASLYADAHAGELPVICSSADSRYFVVVEPQTYEMVRDKLTADGWRVWKYRLPAESDEYWESNQLTFLEGLRDAFRP